MTDIGTNTTLGTFWYVVTVPEINYLSLIVIGKVEFTNSV